MDLFSPLTLGELQLRNRVVMAPMTRSRAEAGGAPGEHVATYYAQRASAGMIISEGIAPSADGLGYCRTPGLFNAEQVTAWRRVTDGVHEAGGTMIAQLMHVGRVASAYNKPEGARTVAPSAIRARGEIYTDAAGMQPLEEPTALSLEDIPEVIGDYRRAARNALDAGFDGVELHCTSGYLPAQFLSTGSNKRTDGYGGSVQNRIRFPVEVLQALTEEVGCGRVGMRICPDNPFNDLQDDDPEDTFEHLLSAAAALDLAYLHAIRMPSGRVDNLALGRKHFPGRLIGNDSYSAEEASAAIIGEQLSAVSFGRLFIANPDLVERFRNGSELARMDLATLYTPGPEGYTSYPALS